MGDEYQISLAGAEITMDIDFLVQLGSLDAAFTRNPQDPATIARAFYFLEYARRQDLLGIWAERAFAMNPKHETSLFAMASCYELIGRFDLAIPLWRSLSNMYRASDPLQLCLSQSLCANGDLIESSEIIEAAFERFDSGQSIRARIWDHDQYLQRFRAARGEVRLRAGDARGFIDHEAYFNFHVPSFRIPQIALWQNEDLHGKHLLVTPVGGYGDQLLFNSLIPQLAALGARVSIAVHSDLYELIKASFPGLHIFRTALPQSLHDAPSIEIQNFISQFKPDYYTTSFGLPAGLHRLAASAALRLQPYLSVPESAQKAHRSELAALRTRAGDRALVGITWDRAQRHFPQVVGGIEACRTARTSLPVPNLLTILNNTDLAQCVHFVALHESHARRAWPNPTPQNLSTLPIAPGDFAHTGAAIAACDLVISVDMSVANLSAMLGKETWLVLAHEGDVRWGYRGNTTPWVRNTRAFRQQTPRDWSHVCQDLTVELAQLPTPRHYTAL